MQNQAEFLTLRDHLQQVIIGQTALLERLMISLLTGGHILLEGPPGLAKTKAVNTLASGVRASFQRIQFTPDLMPGDLTGSDIFDPEAHAFRFIEGPIFHEIVLADEINRAPPKVQSALLEAMAEHQVTVGGVTRPLPELFVVMATQNPLEQSGTYPLPARRSWIAFCCTACCITRRRTKNWPSCNSTASCTTAPTSPPSPPPCNPPRCWLRGVKWQRFTSKKCSSVTSSA